MTTTVMTYLSAWLPCKDDAAVDDVNKNTDAGAHNDNAHLHPDDGNDAFDFNNNNHSSVCLPSPSFAKWRIIQTHLIRRYGAAALKPHSLSNRGCFKKVRSSSTIWMEVTKPKSYLNYVCELASCYY